MDLFVCLEWEEPEQGRKRRVCFSLCFLCIPYVLVCKYWIKEIFMQRITFLKVCSIFLQYLSFLKLDYHMQKGQTAKKIEFSPVSLWQMISLFSFISSSPMMAIDLGQKEQREID